MLFRRSSNIEDRDLGLECQYELRYYDEIRLSHCPPPLAQTPLPLPQPRTPGPPTPAPEPAAPDPSSLGHLARLPHHQLAMARGRGQVSSVIYQVLECVTRVETH